MSLTALLRQTRVIALTALVAIAPASLNGCANLEPTMGEYTAENDEASLDQVTDVSHTNVKRQSIGNCWIYATATWVESLRRRHASEELNVSETYWTYWHWYQQLTGGEVTGSEMETGGWWGEAADIIRNRGFMTEADFIPSEANAEMSETQRRALATINTSMQSGALSTAEARRNGTLVRDELDRAFGLRPEMVAELDRVFGADGRRSLTNTYPQRTFVRRASELQVGRARTSTGRTRVLSLLDVIGTARNTYNPDQRSGSYAWNGVSFPTSATGRRDFFRRVMRALNDGHPVLISWLVDFNALGSDASFSIANLTNAGRPGRQGGHLTVLEDYTVDLPDGTYLGTGALSAEDRTRALTGTPRFFRTKNSWGSLRPDRPNMAGDFAGYHDLYVDYLQGPINWLNDGDNPNSGTTRRTPLSSVILPPGY